MVTSFPTISDGESWSSGPGDAATVINQITGAINAAETTIAAVPGSYAPIRFFDVKTYGAKGDGTTVDTVAVQAAITACSAAGGGTVFLPAGTYVVSNICLASNVTLAGAGMGASVLLHDPNPAVSPANTSGSGYTYDLPTLRINLTSSTQVNNVVMRDFTVDGNKTVLHTLDTTYRQYGIYVGGATGQPYPYDIQTTRVEVRNCKSYAFDVIRVNRTTFSQCIAHDNGIDGTTNNKSSGWEILADDIKLVDCSSYSNQVGYDCGETGIVHYRVSLIGCTAQGNANEGVEFHDAMQDSQIIGGAYRDNLSHGIAMYSAVTQISITGASVTGNTGNGIRLGLCSYVTVIGNTVDQNSLGGNGNPEIRVMTGCANNVISGNVGATNSSPNHAIVEDSGAGPNLVKGNTFAGTGTSTTAGTNSEWFLNTPPAGQLRVAEIPRVSSDRGIVNNYDSMLATTGSILATAGVVWVGRIWLPTMTVTNILTMCGTTATGLSNCFAGLYDNAGNLLGTTADLSSTWNTSGAKTTALVTPVAVTAGWYRIGLLANTSTSLPTFTRFISGNGANYFESGATPATSTLSFSTDSHTTQSSLPTLGTLTANNNGFWVGVS